MSTAFATIGAVITVAVVYAGIVVLLAPALLVLGHLALAIFYLPVTILTAWRRKMEQDRATGRSETLDEKMRRVARDTFGR